jgi:hypothetical protein
MRLSKARFGGALAASALVLVQAAFAAETLPVKFNAADQAAAKATTLRMSDLGAGWKGGATKPDLTPDQTCATKHSDLLVTGAAKSEFKTEGAFVSSESFVLGSAAMVSADWQRTIGNATLMACVRRELSKQTGAKFVSFKKVAFPGLSRYAARYRAVFDYGTTGSPSLVLIDFIFLGQRRSEITLMVSTPYANRAAADGAGRRLAKILVSRIAA